MDHNLLPPLPSAEELFAPSTSQSPSSCLPFLKNVNLFISTPPLPPLAVDLPPVPPDSIEYTEPYSPIPPQPTSPLVDQLDYQFGGNKTSNAVHQTSSQELTSGSPPPSKKARLSHTTDAVCTSEPSSVLQYDSREEGEISDEPDDIDQVIRPTSVCTTSYHKTPASHLTTASSSEQASRISVSHRRPPTGSSQNVGRILPSSGHHHQSRTSDAAGRTSHRRHHRAHRHHDDEASKSSCRHHQSVDAASLYKTERSSSSQKQSTVHSGGHKEEDHGKGLSRVSSHHRLSSDRTAGAETAKHESRPSSHSDRRTGSSSALDLSPLTSAVHRHGISIATSQSSRLKRQTPESSTLGSEIAKNMSELSAGQKQPCAGFSRAKNALQPPSIQRQLTDDAAVSHTVNNQQQSVNSGKTSSCITVTAEEKSRNRFHHSTRPPDPTKDVTHQSTCHVLSLQSESAVVKTTEKLASQQRKHVVSGNTVGDDITTNQLSVVSRHPSRSHNDGQLSPYIPATQRPHPAVSTTELATTHHASIHLHTLCPKSDLDAPYSPGSLDPDILFEPSVVPGRQEAVSNDDKTDSNIDTSVMPCSSLVPNTAPKSDAMNTNVEDSDVEVDTADVVEETCAAEDVEGVVMTAESAVVEGRGQEYEIIDDLDSNADEMDDNAGGSSDNSEMELNSGDDENSPVKPIKMHHNHRSRQSGGAVKQTWNDLELFDEDGDDDFQAPIVNHKIVLHERGHDPFDILPEGWMIITHLSGMPVFLHKQLRVCTLSRPYFLGRGSARKHNIPVSAVPCLQYRRALEAESSQAKEPQKTQDNASDAKNSENDCPAADEVNSSCSDRRTTAGNHSNDSNTAASSSFNVKVESVEDHKKLKCLEPMEFREYCKRLFEFKTITVRRFRRWKDRRKHNVHLKKASRPLLLPSTKLITCPLPVNKEMHNSKKKEFVLNPAGKSHVCVLHEYAQHALRIQPRYIFQELENAEMPYSATVAIDDIKYGTGYASSKRFAKLEAARITLCILIPEMNKVLKEDETLNLHDLSFFDDIKIEDPRVADLCVKAGQPTPYQVLCDCLKRNFGMGDTKIQMDSKSTKHQKSEFTMRVGKHEAKVRCKNKREGKQLAAQAVLKLMHPQLTTWGSLLRLYSKASEDKEKKAEEHSVTELQTKAQPNKAILSKLRDEMTKLYTKQDAVKMNVKGTVKFTGPNVQSTELGGITL